MADILRVESLTKRYGKDGIENICFSIGEGEKLGLAGRSGAGKTTIAKCIMGLAAPDSGHILFRGREIKGRDISIQMIFQNPGSSLEAGMKARDIIMEGARYWRLLDAPEDEYLTDILEKVSLSWDILGRRPSSMSGGEKARVAIARALAMKPALLIADEAASSLDASLKSGILNVFRTLPVSMLVISHDYPSLEYACDRIITLNDTGTIE